MKNIDEKVFTTIYMKFASLLRNTTRITIVWEEILSTHHLYNRPQKCEIKFRFYYCKKDFFTVV